MDVTRESSDKKHIIHPFHKSPPKKTEQRHKRKSTHFSKSFFFFFFLDMNNLRLLVYEANPARTVLITYTWKHGRNYVSEILQF